MEAIEEDQRMRAPQAIEAPVGGAGPRPYEDLRQWLEIVDSLGELKKLHGAHWKLEIGTLAELIARERQGTIPALLFDKIAEYPAGFRILFGEYCSFSRLALTLGLPLQCAGLQLVDQFRKKLNSLQPLPPRIVKTAGRRKIHRHRLYGDHPRSRRELDQSGNLSGNGA